MGIDITDLFSDFNKKYTDARTKHGATPEDIFKQLKKAIKSGNIKAIETQIKLDRQWPAEQKEIDLGANTLSHLDGYELQQRLVALVSMLSDTAKKELMENLLENNNALKAIEHND